ncbi:MAG: hypothetical protein ACYC2T_10135, partial [Bacillota bacterium]
MNTTGVSVSGFTSMHILRLILEMNLSAFGPPPNSPCGLRQWQRLNLSCLRFLNLSSEIVPGSKSR